MRFILLALLIASGSAFRAPSSLLRTTKPLRSSSIELSAKPARVVEDKLPKVYVYDHCPFCVRVRLALGLKNIKHELVFMANDDVDTPTALIGKKVAPILEMPTDDFIMNESLDICAYFDENERFGATGLIKPASGRDDIKAWQKKLQSTMRMLTRPRYMQTCLPEFMQQDGKNAFVKNHQLPPYEKAEWKSDDMTMEQRWGLYTEALGEGEEHIAKLNEALQELEGMIYSEEYCTEGGLSYDDIDLWARLRSLTLIKGAVFPEKVMNYLKNFEELGDVPLYFNMAI